MEKTITMLAVIVTSLLSVWFIIRGNFELAVLFLTLMFTCTNFTRYRSAQRQGLEKEAKWMRGSMLVFAVLFILVLVFVVIL